MKFLATIALAAFTTMTFAKEEPKKPADKPAAVQNDNCVKKDKNGKCPPLPNSPKPTPKKPAEKK